MNNAMRKTKYEILIDDINEALNVWHNYMHDASEQPFTPLDMVFNRAKVNEYANIIMKKADIGLREKISSFSDPWAESYADSIIDDAEKIPAIKDFVKYCKLSHNRDAGYALIFWSLMILSVDDTDADDKLSLICDIARMLKITDDELIDIAYVIKTVYNDVDDGYKIKTDMAKKVFGKVIKLYS